DGAILDRSGIGRGNAGDGLHLVVINQGYAMSGATPDQWGTLLGTLLNEFQELHRGYRLATVLGEVFGEEGVSVVATSGVYAHLYRFRSRAADGTDVPSALFWMTQREAIERCSALLPMFTYSPPRLGLTRSEQELLCEAVHGTTDAELSE